MIRKILLTFFLFLATSTLLSAQNAETFAIYPGSEYAVSDLVDALDMCTLDKYREPEARVNMKFDDGSIVELFSARELKDLNISFEESHINTSGTKLNNTFTLHPKGYIIENVKRWSKEEMAKNWNK